MDPPGALGHDIEVYSCVLWYLDVISAIANQQVQIVSVSAGGRLCFGGYPLQIMHAWWGLGRMGGLQGPFLSSWAGCH